MYQKFTALLQVLLLASCVFPLYVTASPLPDATFGTGGSADLFAADAAIRPASSVANIVVEPSGRILVAGATRERGISEWILERFTDTGHVDLNFGAAGKIYPKITRCNGAIRIAVQPSGDIVNFAGDADALRCDFYRPTVAFRFSRRGEVRPEFKPALEQGARSADVALGMRPDGRLLLGQSVGPNRNTFVIQQFQADGTADTTFGSSGKNEVSLITGGEPTEHDVVVLPDGSATFAVYGGLYTMMSLPQLVFYKINASGSPSEQFGVDGKFTYAVPVDVPKTSEAQQLVSLFLLGDGTYVAAIVEASPDVQADGFNNAVRIVRVTADGKLISATRMFGVSAARTQWSFKALADSSVIVARSSQDVDSSSTVLFRLSRDDTLDPAFGPGGAFTIDDMSHVSALALDNAGRLLVSGQVRDQFVVRRYVFQPAPVGTVVEFFNTLLQHYFLTADPAEANAIDAGAAGAGWSRTGLKFKSGGPTLVCRFYGNANRSADDTPYGPNSHFYTADPSECGGLVDLYNPAAKSWKYESHDFATTLPNGTAGQPACPAGLVAVYRAYNDGFARGIDSNHRIVSSQAAIQEVVSRGWINEGIVMCAPT